MLVAPAAACPRLNPHIAGSISRKGGEDPAMAELALTALVIALIIRLLDRV